MQIQTVILQRLLLNMSQGAFLPVNKRNNKAAIEPDQPEKIDISLTGFKYKQSDPWALPSTEAAHWSLKETKHTASHLHFPYGRRTGKRAVFGGHLMVQTTFSEPTR